MAQPPQAEDRPSPQREPPSCQAGGAPRRSPRPAGRHRVRPFHATRPAQWTHPVRRQTSICPGAHFLAADRPQAVAGGQWRGRRVDPGLLSGMDVVLFGLTGDELLFCAYPQGRRRSTLPGPETLRRIPSIGHSLDEHRVRRAVCLGYIGRFTTQCATDALDARHATRRLRQLAPAPPELDATKPASVVVLDDRCCYRSEEWPPQSVSCKARPDERYDKTLSEDAFDLWEVFLIVLAVLAVVYALRRPPFPDVESAQEIDEFRRKYGPAPQLRARRRVADS